MLTIEQVRERLKVYKLKHVAELSGINPTTIYAIAAGRIRDPNYSTVKKLSDYLTANETVG